MRPSVVMPAYNAWATIANAINSILNQSHKEFELVIIDDGSTDNTEQEVKKFDDHRIVYQKIGHSGIVHARNTGNSIATGDVIVLQDADDLSMPDRLEKCLEALKDCDVVYHALYVNMWDAQYNCIGRKYVPAESFDLERLKKEQYIPGACVFRKKCWEAKPFRKETEHAFDYMMHLDFSLSGFKYKALDTGLYEYVRQQNSASQTYEKDGRRQQSMDMIKEILKKEYATG